MSLWAQSHPDWIEQVYSREIYPVLSTAVGSLPSLVSFSVAEWFVIVFILFCLGYIIYYVYLIVFFKNMAAAPTRALSTTENKTTRKTAVAEDAVPAEGMLASTVATVASADAAHVTVASDTDTVTATESADTTKVSAGNPKEKVKGRSKGGRGLMIYRAVMGAVAIASMVYFCFTVLCGLNYYRQPFISNTTYSVEQYSTQELEQLCRTLAEEAGTARVRLEETYKQEDFNYYAEHSVKAIQNLAEQYPVLFREHYIAPKPVLMSPAMIATGISGIYFPFTAEPNINSNASAFALPAAMTHELAHECGFMREDEASFIAYLACKQSDEPLVRYSGLMSAFTYSISDLKLENPKSARDILASLPESVQFDMEQREQYWAERPGDFSDLFDDINDKYLKAYNQEDGIQTYDKVVDLLLAEQRAALELSEHLDSANN